MTAKDRHSKTADEDDRNEWSTPDHVFEPLNRAFKFTCDLAATSENAQVPKYITKDMDALTIEWPPYGWSWCNPPFDGIADFADKATHEHRGKRGRSILLLPSNRCAQEWFIDMAGADYLVMIRKRVNYVPPHGVEASSVGFGSMLLVYGDPNSAQMQALSNIGVVLKQA